MFGKLKCASGKGCFCTSDSSSFLNESESKSIKSININKFRCNATCKENSTSKEVKVFFTNARSLRNTLDELYGYMLVENIDVVCITESWINEELFGDFTYE